MHRLYSYLRKRKRRHKRYYRLSMEVNESHIRVQTNVLNDVIHGCGSDEIQRRLT